MRISISHVNPISMGDWVGREQRENGNENEEKIKKNKFRYHSDFNSYFRSLLSKYLRVPMYLVRNN